MNENENDICTASQRCENENYQARLSKSVKFFGGNY